MGKEDAAIDILVQAMSDERLRVSLLMAIDQRLLWFR